MEVRHTNFDYCTIYNMNCQLKILTLVTGNPQFMINGIIYVLINYLVVFIDLLNEHILIMKVTLQLGDNVSSFSDLRAVWFVWTN